MLDLVGRADGPLADARLWHLTVVESRLLTPNLQRLTLSAPDLSGLHYEAGQDLMFRFLRADGSVTNRRYTIRRFDAERAEVTIDVSLHGAGPGTDWIRSAQVGDQIDAIGPRGKITPHLEADWHLFVADETGMPGAFAMIEVLPTSKVRAIIEIDTPADEQEPDLSSGTQLELRWIQRLERSVPGDLSPLQEALVDLTLPDGDGHAYLAAESAVVRSIRALLMERGLRSEQISAKAYWRRGLPNADHGEPTR
jgi:NADPH-dependent ferric siderophore reductase